MKLHLNLLPLRYQRKQLVLLGIKRWSAIWAVAAVVLGLMGWSQWSSCRSSRAQLTALQREYQPVDEMSSEVETLRAEIEALEEREALVLKLADERPLVTLMGLLSRAARQCDGGVGIGALVLQRHDRGAEVTKTLTLSGLAIDNKSVATFASALRENKAFRDVELKGTGIKRRSDRELRTYSLECTF